MINLRDACLKEPLGSIGLSLLVGCHCIRGLRNDAVAKKLSCGIEQLTNGCRI